MLWLAQGMTRTQLALVPCMRKSLSFRQHSQVASHGVQVSSVTNFHRAHSASLLSFSHLHGLQPVSTCFCSKISLNAERGAKQGALRRQPDRVMDCAAELRARQLKTARLSLKVCGIRAVHVDTIIQNSLKTK